MRDARLKVQPLRQVFWGIVTAFVSIALLFGGISLSLAEGNLRLPTPSLPPTITPTWQPFPSLMDSPTSLPPTQTPSLPPPPTNCPPPAGWLPYTVQPGDTLNGLALQYKKTSAEISAANCLVTTGLLPGLVVYLPPVPTRTSIPCGAPRTWVIYIVKHGDTLYHLGEVYGIPYKNIQTANCLTSSWIFTGQQLYVPPWATRTPSPTIPGTTTPTGTPSSTPVMPTSIQPSNTPSEPWTDAPTATFTPTDTETATDTPTSTFTPVTTTP